MKDFRFLFPFIAILGIASASLAQEQVFQTGLVVPADIKARHAKSWAKHGRVLKAMPQVTATKFDCREMGWVPDPNNQGNCGSCWVFSGADAAASAFRKAGYGAKLNISKQQLLDCQFRSACNGGWPEDVAKVAMTAGLVTDEDYGEPYKARPGTCKQVDSSKVLKLIDYGFCSQADGVAKYEDFKNCMVKYGVISICYASSGTPSGGENGPIWKGNGSRNIDHAIKAIAFDDARSPKGAVLCWNQWHGGSGDLFWAEWGANGIGTSAMWCLAKQIQPDPIPPGPTPPTPGGVPPFFNYVGSVKIGTTSGYPTAVAAITDGQKYANSEGATVVVKDSKGTLIATLTPGEPSIGSIVIDPVTKVVTIPPGWTVAGGVTEQLRAELMTAGVNPLIIVDILQLLADLKNKAGIAVILADIMRIIAGFNETPKIEDVPKKLPTSLTDGAKDLSLFLLPTLSAPVGENIPAKPTPTRTTCPKCESSWNTRDFSGPGCLNRDCARSSPRLLKVANPRPLNYSGFPNSSRWSDPQNCPPSG